MPLKKDIDVRNRGLGDKTIDGGALEQENGLVKLVLFRQGLSGHRVRSHYSTV